MTTSFTTTVIDPDILELKPVRGWLDNSLEFHTSLENLKRSGHKKILLDFSEERFLNSVGVGALISLYTTLYKAGGEMVFLQPNARVKETLDLTRLSQVLYITNDRDDAIKHLRDADTSATVNS
jgi:anti-anti-sigma factor